MQTYILHWQFPDQESHMQGAEAFAGFVEGGCEGDEFDGFKVLKPRKIAKKKTLTSLGDGDSYHDKLKRNKQPHQ